MAIGGGLERSIYQKGFDIIQQYAKNAEKLVITEESIWIRQYRRKDFWHNVKKDAKEAGCDIKVIVYIRRQDLYAQALWNQSVKYVPIRVPRMGKTFSEFLKSKAFEDRHADYYQTLSEIAQCIGKENIIVRVFEKEMFIRSKCGIYEDFMNAIGEQMQPDYCIPEENKNERLDGNLIEIKRLINTLPSYNELPLDYMYQKYFYALNQMFPGKKSSYFSYEEQLNFLKEYEESNRRVAKEFLGREDGILFTEPVERLPKWEVDKDKIYEDVILLFADIAVAQEKRLERLEKKQRDLEWELHNPIVHFKKISKKIKSKMKDQLK